MRKKRNIKKINRFNLLLLFLVLFFTNKSDGQVILSVTNRPDPFGPLPANTTNIIHISANDDLVDIFYTTTIPPYIVRRLYNAVTSSVDQTHIWNGQDDNGINCPPGTYKAKIKLNRIATYYTKLPPNKNFIDFSAPRDVAVDRWGNVYVIDYSLCIVEKFSPNGSLILKFGSPGTGNGEFSNPLGITVDTNGYIYVSDDLGSTGRIQKFTSDGIYTNSYTSTTYTAPQGMGYDASINRIYFVDVDSDDIVRLNPVTMTSDVVNTSMGNWNPTDIAIDPDDGDLYVVVLGAWVLRFTRAQFESNGNYNNAWNIGSDGYWGITIRSNWFYIVATNSDFINQCDKGSGSSVESFGSTGDGNGEFNTPYSIGYDSVNDILWVSDSGNNRLQEIKDSGTMTNIGSINSDPRGLINPSDIALDRDGNLYVCDTGHHCVKKFDKFGNFLMQIGSYGTGVGKFINPRGVAIDKYNYIYVSDYDNNVIQKFSPAGTVVTQWNVIQPVGMCTTPDGTNIVYIRNRTTSASAYENRMIRMNLNGVVLQDFQLGYNDVSYYDLDVNSQGYTYCISAGSGNYIDRYPPNASGTVYPNWIGAGNPNGVAIDDFDTLWVPRGYNDVRVYNLPMQLLYQFGSAGSGDGEFDNPNNAAIQILDLPGEWADLWIVDSGNNRVEKFIITWGSSYDEMVTIANAGYPFVTAAYPDDTISTNVNVVNGVYYVRSGKTYFKIYFSQSMNTNIHPVVKYTFNSVQYDIKEESYINNVWSGTAYISTNMGEGTATFYITGAVSTSGSNLNPDPDTSYSFIIDTVPPNPPYVEQPPSPTTYTDITVNGTTEAEIYVNVYNYTLASNGTLISYQSNILSDSTGDFTATSIKLLTPKPSTNFITAIAIDKAGNISKEYRPRRLVKCINSGGGTAYITPSDDKYLGENGKPDLNFIWTADAQMKNASVIIDIPLHWASPSLIPGNPGYVYIKESYNITFVGYPTNLQVSSNKIKVCFNEAIAGGYFTLVYGTNNLTMVSNNAKVGINNFVMHSTNDDISFKSNWNLQQLVYPASGGQLYINVKPLPVYIYHQNLLANIVYVGEHYVDAFNIFATNVNTYYDMDIYYIKMKTTDTNDLSIIPSSAISAVYIYTNDQYFYYDNSIETTGDLITLDLSSSPLTINKKSLKKITLKIDISASATAKSLKLWIEKSNSIVVKEKESLVDGEVRVTNDSFPIFSTNCAIISNERITKFFTSFSNKMGYYVDTSQAGVIPINYVFYNTNKNGNDLHITSMKLSIFNKDNIPLIPANVISKIIVQDISGSPVYLTKTAIETNGNKIFLDLYPSGLYISANTSSTVSIVLDISSSPAVTNFKIGITYSTNIKGEDNILKTESTNYPYSGYTFPMESSDADIVDHFLIYHQTNTMINLWSPVVIKVVNINNGIIKRYNGVITLDTDGTPATIDWTNIYGNGTLNNILNDDKAIYMFSLLDNGVVTLNILDSTVESVDIDTRDKWISDNDIEGYLYFQGVPLIDIVKTVTPRKARPFEKLDYEITYSNTTSYIANNFKVIESLPQDVFLITNSAEKSNTPHAGSVTVYFATNYTNYIWLPFTFDDNITNCRKVKKIKWVMDTPVGSHQKGILRFKAIVK